MKIGYFITNFPYSDLVRNDKEFDRYICGGAPFAAYYLAFNMANRDHEIDVFTTSVDSKDSIEKHENVTIYRYGTNFRVLSSNISFGRFLKPIKHMVDIAHTHFDIPPGPLAGLRYAKKKNVPLVVTYHGDWVESYGGLIRRVGVTFHNKYLVDKLLSYADVIISPSGYYINGSRFLRKYLDKIVVIPNGVNLWEFDIGYSKEECKKKLGLPRDKKILLFFGYLAPYKGPDVLVNAMSKIIKHVPDTELVFAGKGVMRDELEMLSKNLGIEKNVRFAGFVDDDLKGLYYKAADIFCLPSMMSTECYPLTILEAMACGVPIVASKIGGIPDAVRGGVNGLLVQPRDCNALANAIIYLLENDDVREKMGKKGVEEIHDYSWERIAEETEKVYEMVLK